MGAQKPWVLGGLEWGHRFYGDYNRQRHVSRTQILDQSNAGQAGQFVLGNQKMVAICLQLLPPSTAIGGETHLVAMMPEPFNVKLKNVSIVIHDENAIRRIRIALPS
jgi:hypothetical protein